MANPAVDVILKRGLPLRMMAVLCVPSLDVKFCKSIRYQLDGRANLISEKGQGDEEKR
jgi:hypothetical protein